MSKNKLQKQAEAKAANAVAKAATDGTVKASELQRAVQLYGQAAVAKALAPAAAANSSLVIGSGAKDLTGVRTKGGVVSYTPASWQYNDKTSGTIKTGTVNVDGLGPQFVSNAAGGYTYMGPGVAAQASSAAGATPGGTPPESQSWADSVDAGTQAMINTLNATVEQNKANQQLYMGMIESLNAQMSAASKQGFAGPYAVTTSTTNPAMGAQVTQAIAPRRKFLNTSLAIAPSESATAGTGLNIAA